MFHFCRHKSCSFIESDFKVLQAEPSRQWMPPMSMSNQYAVFSTRVYIAFGGAGVQEV